MILIRDRAWLENRVLSDLSVTGSFWRWARWEKLSDHSSMLQSTWEMSGQLPHIQQSQIGSRRRPWSIQLDNPDTDLTVLDAEEDEDENILSKTSWPVGDLKAMLETVPICHIPTAQVNFWERMMKKERIEDMTQTIPWTRF